MVDVKVAVTLLFDVMATVQVMPEVESQPVKLVKLEPVAAVAVMMTEVP